MTFTKTPPTTPGFYAWRRDAGCQPEAIVLIPNDQTETPCQARLGRYKGEEYGEWCRLVPAEEVKEAWHEGRQNQYLHWEDAWNSSRAKRVAEGIE